MNDMDEEQAAITVLYTNHRGETNMRRIIPIRLFLGASPWHERRQWLLECFDVDKEERRTFAMRDIHGWYYGGE